MQVTLMDKVAGANDTSGGRRGGGPGDVWLMSSLLSSIKLPGRFMM